MAKTIRVVTEGDISKGLKVEAGKLLVEIDESTLEFKGNQLAAKIPTNNVDLRVTAIAADQQTGKLKITVADAEGGNTQTVETTLSGLIAMSKNLDNLATIDNGGIYVSPEHVKQAAAGAATVTFQSLGEEVLGYAFETRPTASA
jgi:multidrug resistance efflux pump